MWHAPWVDMSWSSMATPGPRVHSETIMPVVAAPSCLQASLQYPYRCQSINAFNANVKLQHSDVC